MPYRKRRTARRRPRRRFVRRRRARISRNLGGTLGLFGSPTVKRTLKYVENITMSSTTGSIFHQLFSANGLYDPNTTGTGHQPIFFDQIMPYFNHYSVVGSKISVVLTHRVSTMSTDATVAVGLALRGTVATHASYQLYMENGQERHVMMPPDPSVRNHLSMGFAAKKYFGKKYVVDNYDLKGTASNNPAEGAFFHIYIDPMTGTDSPVINALVSITYHAIFSEPKAAFTGS